MYYQKKKHLKKYNAVHKPSTCIKTDMRAFCSCIVVYFRNHFPEQQRQFPVPPETGPSENRPISSVPVMAGLQRLHCIII